MTGGSRGWLNNSSWRETARTNLRRALMFSDRAHDRQARPNSLGLMGDLEFTPARGAAAFFDLDKTTIANAALFAFSSTLRDAGYINGRLILRAVWGRMIFKYFGADHERMEDMRNHALRLCKGWDKRHVSALVTDALEEVMEPIVFREAIEEIDAHRAAGHKVFMVSASPEEVVVPLSKYLGADGAVATIAQVDRAGKYTGEVEFYSYGPFKVDAMEALALEHDLDLAECYAYTDSITDLPMLEAVGHPVVVNPDRALAKIAIDRGWEVRTFSNTVPLRQRVGEHAKTGALVAGAGALAGGASWYFRSKRRSA